MKHHEQERIRQVMPSLCARVERSFAVMKLVRLPQQGESMLQTVYAVLPDIPNEHKYQRKQKLPDKTVRLDNHSWQYSAARNLQKLSERGLHYETNEQHRGQVQGVVNEIE